jgi:hypothetical protein
MKTKYKAMVNDQGRMVLLDHALFQENMKSFKKGEVFYLIVERHRRHLENQERHDSWRRYYWAVVATMIAEETGHSKDAIHEALKRKILGYTDERTGLEMVPSVFSDGSTLTLAEKKAFIDEVRRWAADFLNLWIPDPERAIF